MDTKEGAGHCAAGKTWQRLGLLPPNATPSGLHGADHPAEPSGILTTLSASTAADLGHIGGGGRSVIGVVVVMVFLIILFCDILGWRCVPVTLALDFVMIRW